MVEIEKALRLLGLAYRARKLALGKDACMMSLKKGKAQLVVLAEDLSENAAAKVRRLAGGKGVAVVCAGTKDDFGKGFGRDELGILAVEESGFAAAIQKLLT